MRRRRSGSPGFTLIELQVVFGLVLMVLAMMIPGLGKSQETMRREACRDNFKQIAIAMLNYNDVFRAFPPGWVHQAKQRSNYGWGTSILPFIEQQPLYEDINMGHPSFAVALMDLDRRRALKTVIPVYVCPSDDLPPQNEANVPEDNQGEPQQVTSSSYVGSHDSQSWKRHGEQFTGVFAENSSIRFRDILDGSSNTVMLGERTSSFGDENSDDTQCGAAIAWGVGGDGEMVSQHFNLAIGKPGINSTEVDAESKREQCRDGYSARHPKGSQFAFSDGHIRFISESIDTNTLRLIIDRRDGMPVQLDDE